MLDKVLNTPPQIMKKISLRENCPYSEFFWSVFSPNAENLGPEKLQTRTLFTQYILHILQKRNHSDPDV